MAGLDLGSKKTVCWWLRNCVPFFLSALQVLHLLCAPAPRVLLEGSPQPLCGSGLLPGCSHLTSGSGARPQQADLDSRGSGWLQGSSQQDRWLRGEARSPRNDRAVRGERSQGGPQLVHGSRSLLPGGFTLENAAAAQPRGRSAVTGKADGGFGELLPPADLGSQSPTGLETARRFHPEVWQRRGSQGGPGGVTRTFQVHYSAYQGCPPPCTPGLCACGRSGPRLNGAALSGPPCISLSTHCTPCAQYLAPRFMEQPTPLCVSPTNWSLRCRQLAGPALLWPVRWALPRGAFPSTHGARLLKDFSWACQMYF